MKSEKKFTSLIFRHYLIPEIDTVSYRYRSHEKRNVVIGGDNINLTFYPCATLFGHLLTTQNFISNTFYCNKLPLELVLGEINCKFFLVKFRGIPNIPSCTQKCVFVFMLVHKSTKYEDLKCSEQ